MSANSTPDLRAILADMAEGYAAACRHSARIERSMCNDPAADRDEINARAAEREAAYHRNAR